MIDLLDMPEERYEATTGRLVTFGRPGGLQVGRGVLRVLRPTASDDPTLGDRIRMLLKPGQRAFVALGFDPAEPAVVVIPETLGVTPPGVDTGTPGLVDRAYSLDDDAYAASVERLLAAMSDEPDLQKVVLGRWLDSTYDRPIDVGRLTASLARRSPHAWVYALPLPSGGHLVGASPELLVSRRRGTVRTVPLAGSRPRADEAAEDLRRGRSLAASPKDLREHRHVVDAVLAGLRSRCTGLPDDPRPEVIATDSMWHLATVIDAHSDTHGLVSLAQAIHPTPAVGGVPLRRARDHIAAFEGRPRGLMTGAVGWVDAEGDGELVVAIRSAVVEGAQVRMFAGAGIVPGSDPRAEARETAAKLRTVATALEEM